MSAKYSHSCPSLVTVQQQPCLRQTSMLPTCRRKPSTLQINTSKGTLTRQHAQANVWHQWLLVGEWREWWEFPVGLISLVWLRAGQWVSIPIIFHTLTYEETRSTQVLIKRVIEREMFLSTHIHTHTHTHTQVYPLIGRELKRQKGVYLKGSLSRQRQRLQWGSRWRATRFVTWLCPFFQCGSGFHRL
jgi:hypothetical protein